MPETTISLYNHVSEILANAQLDLDANTLKLALVTSGYTFDATHTLWSSASGSEVANGNGYTTGGASVGSLALTRSADVTTLDGADTVWAALTKTFRAAVLYASGTFGGKVNPVLAYILFDNTPADVSVAGVNFSVIWPASGILQVKKG